MRNRVTAFSVLLILCLGVSVRSLRAASDGMPTAEEIAQFVTATTNAADGLRTVFTASFTAVQPKAGKETEKYRKSGTIPVRITCELDDIKKVGSREVSKLVSGTVNICITDEDGKMVLSKAVSLDKMCPT